MNNDRAVQLRSRRISADDYTAIKTSTPPSLSRPFNLAILDIRVQPHESDTWWACRSSAQRLQEPGVVSSPTNIFSCRATTSIRIAVDRWGAPVPAPPGTVRSPNHPPASSAARIPSLILSDNITRPVCHPIPALRIPWCPSPTPARPPAASVRTSHRMTAHASPVSDGLLSLLPTMDRCPNCHGCDPGDLTASELRVATSVPTPVL